jgi:hypothetical protein
MNTMWYFNWQFRKVIIYLVDNEYNVIALMKWYVSIMSRWSDMSSIIQFHLWILLCLDEVMCQVLFSFIYEFYYV